MSTTTLYAWDDVSLAQAIKTANTASGSVTLKLGFGEGPGEPTGPVYITLNGELPALLHSITVEGNGSTIDGLDIHRGFLVLALDTMPVDVAISNMTFTHTVARGGDGGDTAYNLGTGSLAGPGGGGAGFGGGLFVGAGATVTIQDVAFDHAGAVGGDGGSGFQDYHGGRANSGIAGGGGGGMGGNGGDSANDHGPGGGGIGYGADGGGLYTNQGFAGSVVGGGYAASGSNIVTYNHYAVYTETRITYGGEGGANAGGGGVGVGGGGGGGGIDAPYPGDKQNGDVGFQFNWSVRGLVQDIVTVAIVSAFPGAGLALSLGAMAASNALMRLIDAGLEAGGQDLDSLPNYQIGNRAGSDEDGMGIPGAGAVFAKPISAGASKLLTDDLSIPTGFGGSVLFGNDAKNVPGGPGGFGGGGGGGGSDSLGGRGGFGGGGGGTGTDFNNDLAHSGERSSGIGGMGGFGGGAGGRYAFLDPYYGNRPGIGGGLAQIYTDENDIVRLGGGGGFGAGGAIFVQEGGTLIDRGTTVTDAHVQGGAGGTTPHWEYSQELGRQVWIDGSGKAAGTGVFLQGMAHLTVDSSYGPLVIGNIADTAGTPDALGTYTNDVTINGIAVNRGAVDIIGSGRVLLTGQNTYLGGTWIGAELMTPPPGVTDENSSNFGRFPTGGATLEITPGTKLYGGIYVYGDIFMGAGTQHSTLVVDRGVVLDRSIVIVHAPGIDQFHTALVNGLEARLNENPLTLDLSTGGLFTGRIIGLLPGQSVTVLGGGLDAPSFAPTIQGDTLTVYAQYYSYPVNKDEFATKAVLNTVALSETAATRRFWAGTSDTLQLTLDFLATHPLKTSPTDPQFFFDSSLGPERPTILLDAQIGSIITLGDIVVPTLGVPVLLANNGSFYSGSDPWADNRAPGTSPHQAVQLLGGSITLNPNTALTLFGGDPRTLITTVPEVRLEVSSPILDGSGPSQLHTQGGVLLSGYNSFSGGLLFNGLLELDRVQAAGSGRLTFEHVATKQGFALSQPRLTLPDGLFLSAWTHAVDDRTVIEPSKVVLSQVYDSRVATAGTVTITSDGHGHLTVGKTALAFEGDRDGGWSFTLSIDPSQGTVIDLPTAVIAPAIDRIASGRVTPTELRINGTALPANPIADFGTDGVIHLRDIADSRLDGATSIAVLSDGAGNLAIGGQVLHFAGDVRGGTRFLLASDGQGGTLIHTTLVNNVFAGGNGAWEFDWTVRYLNILNGHTTPQSGDAYLRDSLRPTDADIRFALAGDAVLGGEARGIFGASSVNGFEVDPVIYAGPGHDFILDGDGHALAWHGNAALTFGSGRSFLENLTFSGAMRVKAGASLILDNSHMAPLSSVAIDAGGRVEVTAGTLRDVTEAVAGRVASGAFPTGVSMLLATPGAGQTVTVQGDIWDLGTGSYGNLVIGDPEAIAAGTGLMEGGRVILKGNASLVQVLNNTTLELPSQALSATTVELLSPVGSVLELDGGPFAVGAVEFSHRIGEIDLRGAFATTTQLLTVDQDGMLRIPGAVINNVANGRIPLAGVYGPGSQFLLVAGDDGAQLVPLVQDATIGTQRELDGLIPFLNHLPGLGALQVTVDLTGIVAIDHAGPQLHVPGLGLDISDGPGVAGGFAIGAGVTFSLDGHNSFSGGVTLADGSTLQLANPDAAGTGDITFDGAAIALMLTRDGLANAIRGLLPSDYIDIAGFATTGSSRVAVDGTGNLTLADAMGSVTLHLPDLANVELVRLSDGTGGTILARPVTVRLANDTGISDADGITYDPTIEGTSFPDAALLISIDGATPYLAFADAQGHWSTRPTLDDGVHSLSAIQADLVGNAGRVSISFTLDTYAPQLVPGIDSVAEDSGDSDTDGLVRAGAVTLTGHAGADGFVTVSEGDKILGTAVAGADRTWTLATSLAEGQHVLDVAVADVAGNLTRGLKTFTVTVDETAPALTLALTQDTGSAADDGLTNDATVSGLSDAGRTVTLTEGESVLGTAVVDADGHWSIAPVLADGSHTLKASVTDAAGNRTEQSLDIVLDTTPRVVTEALVVPVSGGVTTSAAIAGSADPGALVTLRDGATLLGSVTADKTGAWSFAPVLKNGAHTLTASVTDAAGNTGSASRSFTLQVPPPVVTAALAHDTGASATDRITADPTLAGLGDPNAVVTIRNGATVLGTTTADGTGHWSYTPDLADGAYTLTAAETNAAGSTGTATLSFTLNTNIVTGIAVTPVGGPIGLGGAIRFTLTTSRADEVFGGTPHLLLSNGAQANYSAAASSAGHLAFDYTAAAGQDTTNLKVTGLTLGGEIGVAGTGKAYVVDGTFAIGLPDGRPSGFGGVEFSDMPGAVLTNLIVDVHPNNTGLLSFALVQADGNAGFYVSPAYSVATYSYLGSFHRPGAADDGFIVYRLPDTGGLGGGIGLLEGSAVPYGSTTGALVAPGVAGTPRAAVAVAQTSGGTPNGLMTLAVVNNDGSLSLFFETPQHGFSAPITLTTGGLGMQASTISTAVLTADGGTSLILSRFGGPVGVMLPSDGAPTIYTASAADVAVADVNGDGFADLLVADFSAGAAKVLLNDHTGHFGTPISYAAGSSPFGIAAGDLNGDGAPDIVVGRFGGSITVLMNDGTGGFTQGGSFAAGAAVGGAAIGSFAPGETDILVTRSDGKLAVMRPAPALTSALDLLSLPAAPGVATGLVIDTVAPMAPAITGISADTGTAGDGITAARRLVLSGTAEAGAKVELALDGSSLGTAVADGSGAWSFDNTATALALGAHVLNATATDAAGNRSAAWADFALTIVATELAVAALSAGKAEGQSGTTAFTFTVTRSGDLSATHSASWAVTGSGPAPADAADFAGGVLPSGTVTFAAGEASRIITVLVAGDTVSEAAEGFTLTLSAPSDGATITVATAIGTILNDDTGILGTSGDDSLDGTRDADTIMGLGGADTVQAGRGDDTVDGGTGDDLLTGGPGNDLLDGGPGADTLVGGMGDDVFVVDAPDDLVIEGRNDGTDLVRASVSVTLAANVENLLLLAPGLVGTGNELANLLTGSDGADTLRGAEGGDTLVGNAGDDSLDGGAGRDVMTGGAGNDTYAVDNAADVVTELPGEGIDLIRSTISWSLGGNLENLVLLGSRRLAGTGNALDNAITGGEADDTLLGLLGADTLIGGAGDDSLDGGLGGDWMAGGAGNDTYVVDDAGDVVVEAAGGGTDLVVASISYMLPDNVEALTLTVSGLSGTGNALANLISGSAGADTLLGAEGADTLLGGAGDDRLDGGSGADRMVGGAGNDTYVVDDPGDVVVEAPDGGVDLVLASISFTLGGNVENLTLTAPGQVGTGNRLDNLLTGSAGGDTLFGMAGNDTLVGRGGDDRLVGGAGADSLSGGAGADTFVFMTPGDAGDVIADFATGVDHIEIRAKGFGSGLVAGMNLATVGRFGANLTGDAGSALGQFTYETDAGVLWWDADGTAPAARLLLATLAGHPIMTAADIVLV